MARAVRRASVNAVKEGFAEPRAGKRQVPQRMRLHVVELAIEIQNRGASVCPHPKGSGLMVSRTQTIPYLRRTWWWRIPRAVIEVLNVRGTAGKRLRQLDRGLVHWCPTT